MKICYIGLGKCCGGPGPQIELAFAQSKIDLFIIGSQLYCLNSWAVKAIFKWLFEDNSGRTRKHCERLTSVC